MSDTKPASQQTSMTVNDGPHAPFVYFEEALTFGHANGLIKVTVSAERASLVHGAPVTDQIVTAYLRTNVQGALALMAALNAALLMAAPVDPTPN